MRTYGSPFIMNVSKKRKADADEGDRVTKGKGPDGAHLVQLGKSAESKSTKDPVPSSSKPGPMPMNVDASFSSSKHVQVKGKGKATNPQEAESAEDPTPKPKPKPKAKLRKLVPPRPWPTVPTSVSATGPRSAHKEGKNYICLTRKTPLGAYLRRCKEVILKDGWAALCSIFIIDSI
jgi:hypothetical protein